MSKLKALKNTSAGDIAYMHPSHPVYEPGNFAIVIRNDKRGVRVLYLDPVKVARVMFPHDDEASDRTVEIVGSALAAKCEGINRDDLRDVARALRDDSVMLWPPHGSLFAGDPQPEVITRVMIARHASDTVEAQVTRSERADLTLQGTPFDEELPITIPSWKIAGMPNDTPHVEGTIPRVNIDEPIALGDGTEGVPVFDPDQNMEAGRVFGDKGEAP